MKGVFARTPESVHEAESEITRLDINHSHRIEFFGYGGVILA